MRHWLARLSFSFLIIAAVLFWTAYKQQTQYPRLYVVLGAVCLGLSFAGIRERHRRDADGEKRE